jgi:hypothetical protein
MPYTLIHQVEAQQCIHTADYTENTGSSVVACAWEAFGRCTITAVPVGRLINLPKGDAWAKQGSRIYFQVSLQVLAVGLGR